MKKLILIFALTIPNFAHATGYRCDAWCAWIDTGAYQVNLIKPDPHYRGALPRNLAYHELEKQCIDLSQAQYGDNRATLYKKITWLQYKDIEHDESHTTTSSGSNSSNVNQYANGVISYGYMGGTAIQNVAQSGSSSTSHQDTSHDKDERTLDLHDIQSSSEDLNCVLDQSIDNRDVPYTGKLHVED